MKEITNPGGYGLLVSPSKGSTEGAAMNFADFMVRESNQAYKMN